MCWTVAKFLWFFIWNISFIMLTPHIRVVLFMIAICTKICVFSDTIYFWWVGWISRTIFAWRILPVYELLLVRINSEINEIAWINLIILINWVLMNEHLWIFLLVIEIDWIKTLWAFNWMMFKLLQRITIRLTNS